MSEKLEKIEINCSNMKILLAKISKDAAKKSLFKQVENRENQN